MTVALSKSPRFAFTVRSPGKRVDCACATKGGPRGLLFIVRTLKIFLTIALLLGLAVSGFAKNHRKPPGVMVPWKTLPASIQTAIQGNAGSGKVKEVQKGTAPNGVVFYCAEVKGTDGKWTKIYVNDAGALIRTEPDKARNKKKHKPLFGW